MSRCVILLFFILACTGVHSQTTNLVFKHLNRSTGLPVDGVNCLAQDSTGFMWIGTKEGLFRYDGFTFKGFFYSPANHMTLPNNYIVSLYVDRKGLIWVSCYGGLVIMKPTGEIIRVINSETFPEFSKQSDRVFYVLERNSTYWIATGDGLYALKLKTGLSVVLEKHDFKKDFGATNELGSFVVDKKGRLWICAITGLLIYDPVKNVLLHPANNPASLEILKEKKAFLSIYLDEDKGLVYYSTWDPSFKIYNLHTNTISIQYSGAGKARPEWNAMVNHFFKDTHHTLWMTTGKGLYMVTAEDSIGKLIAHKQDDKYSLPTDETASLLVDRDGALWVGTTEGISISYPYRQSLVNLSVNNAHEYPFAKSQLSTLIPIDNHSILLGTWGGNGDGLYITDNNFKVKKSFSFRSFDYDWIWATYRQGDSIFISSQKANFIYHTKTAVLTRLTRPPFDKLFPISCFVPGDSGKIWMSRYINDFGLYDPKTGKYKPYSLSGMGEKPTVVRLCKSREGDLWLLSSLAGPLKFDPHEGKISQRFPIGREGLLESHIIFTIDVGEDLLIGYVSEGISLYNKKTGRFHHYSREDGLVSNSVTDALQTDDRTVWITTGNGISRFDLQSRTFINYGYDNGILQNDFVSIFRLPDGRIVAGNTQGLVYFQPDQLKDIHHLAPPMITVINVHGNPLPVDSFSKDKPLNIDYTQNYFSFEYISLQYSNPQQIEYAYKLEGFDNDWVIAGHRRFVSYSNLNGGHYHFRVRARMPGSDWVESSFNLPIVVATPFYKRWWFIPFCVIFFLALAYTVFRYRMHQLLRVEKMRQSISSDLHDEVGASLSSISIFSEMAKQSVASDSKAEQYLQRIGDRSRESIEKMSDIIWSINPNNDSMQQMLIRMKTFVNETVEAKDISIHWQEQGNVSGLKLGMVQRKNFYLLFKEAIINSVKYSGARNIYIELSAHQNSAFLKIRDDGRGFCAETVRYGNGIGNIKQRARLLGGKAVIESKQEEGTTVAVQFRY
jgi:ligand-binding sensor domain-containing protein/signal transduction histidine kinase